MAGNNLVNWGAPLRIETVRLLDRYLLRELLVPLGYCLCGFLVFYVSFDLIFQINRFQDNHLQFVDIIEYYVVTLPELLAEQVLPVSLLLALLYALTNHSRHNELTAMRAAGVGLWRVAVPYLGMGAFFGVIVFVISEYWLPSTAERTRLIMERRLALPGQLDLTPPFVLNNEADHRKWIIGHFNTRTGEMLQPTIAWNRKDGSSRTVHAQSGVYREGKWVFSDAHVWDRAPQDQFDIQTWPTNTTDTNATLPLELSETPGWIRSEIKVNNLSATDAAKGLRLSIREIRDYLHLHEQIDPRKKAVLLTQLQGNIAAPFTCLVVVLIALPFAARTGRHNVFVGVAASIFICFGYFILQRISLGLGVGGYLSPVLAAWLPNIISGGTGLALLSRMR
ncbi:MAG: LptF/LptG family permease [Limisphaerales bacterium]